MIKRCLFLLSLGVFSSIFSEPYSNVVQNLKESPYGFYFVDSGITTEDIKDFESLDIQKESFYHQFGQLNDTQKGIAQFFCEMGNNSAILAERAAALLTRLTQDIMFSSGRDAAWVHLRASPPTDAYNIPRWHIDGAYFKASGLDDIMYRFALTLKGAPTLFYLLPNELRNEAWNHMLNRRYMQLFCSADRIVAPMIGEGVFFLGGKRDSSALHTEPPIKEHRLFFSIVPCSEDQLIPLKNKVIAIYPTN